MNRLSACLITSNEEHSLPRALDSLEGVADEIVVVDTGSMDRTKEIAQEFGARVFDFPWVDSFSAARNAAPGPAAGRAAGSDERSPVQRWRWT